MKKNPIQSNLDKREFKGSRFYFLTYKDARVASLTCRDIIVKKILKNVIVNYRRSTFKVINVYSNIIPKPNYYHIIFLINKFYDPHDNFIGKWI